MSTTENRLETGTPPSPPPEPATGPTPRSGIDPVVLGVSLGLVGVFCVLGAVVPEQVAAVGDVVLTWMVANVGWLFVLAATGFVVYALVVAMSRYGRIRLSRNNEGPEFSTLSWVAMMFSAGMGIGLIFFGVYEPVYHAAFPPPGTGVEPNSPEAVQTSMAYTFFHWGLHPWAIYAVVALALAYSTFRMGRGNLLSAPFQSLTKREGDVADRWWGKAINIWAIVATKFGGATSLGLGALQIAGGLFILTGIGAGFGAEGSTNWVAFAVIAVLVFFAILSAISGVGKGIKWLSNANMVLAAVLVFFVLVTGPTLFLLDLIPSSIGSYLSNVVSLSFRTPAFGGLEWFSSWSIFYWAWWISWTPFVSTFIARISRGRTIREFVAGVLIVPTVVSVLWFVVLGGAGIDLQITGQADLGAALEQDEAVIFFEVLRQYPGFALTGALVIVLVAIFWVSGADASALVLATLSSRGAIEPKRWLTAMWAVASAAVAAVLLYVGGLDALQTFTIIVATPFVLIMVLMCYALYVDLRRDPARASRAGPVRQHVQTPGGYPLAGQQEQLRNGAPDEAADGGEPFDRPLPAGVVRPSEGSNGSESR